MRNLTVLGISTEMTSVAMEAVPQALAPSHISRSFAAPASSGFRDSRADLLGGPDLSAKPMVKVVLKVAGAAPSSSTGRIWVGEQLLVGTMLDEKEQLLTGYVADAVPAEVDVSVEFSDGSRSSFPLKQP